MLSLFFLQQRSHEEKQMTVILGLELTNITCSSVVPVLKATIKQSDQQYPRLWPSSRGVCEGGLPCEILLIMTAPNAFSIKG